MRYAKVLTAEGSLYVEVETREGALWATGAISPPVEDPLEWARAAVKFRPAPLAGFTLQAPVRPTKIICVGRNYRDHAKELDHDIPTEPLIFLKPPSSIVASGAKVVMPGLSKRVDYEGELAIVIGRKCKKLGEGDDPRKYIRGYTLVNDVTARDLQKSDPQWTRGKGYDTFCPVGPLVSDELDPIANALTLTTHLNGELRQTGSTAAFIFGIPELMRYISACMTLCPGDLIPTGTPAGVAAMQPGDVVEVAMDGLGILKNATAAE